MLTGDGGGGLNLIKALLSLSASKSKVGLRIAAIAGGVLKVSFKTLESSSQAYTVRGANLVKANTLSYVVSNP